MFAIRKRKVVYWSSKKMQNRAGQVYAGLKARCTLCQTNVAPAHLSN